MKVPTVLLLLVVAVEVVHCKRSFALWDFLKLSPRESRYDREVKPDEDLERDKRSSFFNYYTYNPDDGSASGVSPEPQPEIWPFSKCVPHYIANRQQGDAIHPQCPPLPTPVGQCDCPDPEHVKTAGNDVILDELNIEVQVHNQYVNVSVNSVVFNPHDGVQLADFALTLPDQAFISYFHINVNDEILVADIEPKEKAEKKFTNAVRRGQTAVTVEARGKNEFSVSVAVSRNCRMRFQLHYEYLVERTTGQFRIPIQVTPSIPALTRRLKVYINDNKPISCVKPEPGSDYDDVAFDMINNNEAELETELSVNQTKEFVITYKVDTDSKRPGTTLVDRNGYMFVSYILPTSNCRALLDDNSTCPVGTVDDGNNNRELSAPPKKPFKLCMLFIVDVSGSMSGEKINQAKKSLLHIIEKLSDDDCIGIILFSSGVQRKTTGLVRVGDERSKLNEIVNDIRAGGLTNFDGALQDGMDVMEKFVNESDTDCVHLMVALTDGSPTTGETIVPDEIAKRFRSKIEHFSEVTGKAFYPYLLGFGSNSDLNFPLLQKLGAENQGFSRRIYRGNDAEKQLIEFFKEIACPVLCSMQLKFQKPGLVNNVTQSDFAGCFFDGSQLLVAGRIDGRLRRGSRVTLKGSSTDGKKILRSNRVINLNSTDGASLVERTWAYLQIKQGLEEVKKLSGEDKKELEKIILELALEYKFVTRLTSLVVVKPCENRTLGNLESVDEKGHTSGQRPSIIPTSGNPSQGLTLNFLPPPSLVVAGGRPAFVRPPVTIPVTRPSTTMPPTTARPPPGVTSDPHFLVETLSGDWLCYTLKGMEGEVYNLLSDVEYSINGLLIGTVFKGSDQTYFGSISISHQSCETGAVTKFLITADNGVAVIGEGSVSWEKEGSFTTRDGTFVVTMNQTLVQISNVVGDTVQFGVLRSQLNCTQYSICPRKHYLGFYAPVTVGLTSKTHGMIGQFLRQPTQCDGVHMSVGGRKLPVKPFERLNGLSGDYQKCWSTDEFGMKFLDGTADDYLVKDLFDNQFVYSNYHCGN